MVPFLISNTVVTAAATAVLTAAFAWSRLDCNPSLYIAHKLLMTRRNNFHNQCIWIVGASSGIGEEMAYQLVAGGGGASSASVSSPSSRSPYPVSVILSSRSRDKLQLVAENCRAINPECTVTVLPLDVSNDVDLEAAVRKLPYKIDCAVLNAGGGHLSPALETLPDMARKMWKLNALWPMVLTPLLFRYHVFKDNSAPTLVVTSSIAARLPVPLSSTYAAAKHAQLGYFRSLNTERPDIRLHMVLPGPIDTDFHRNHHHNEGSSVDGERQSSRDSSTSNDKKGRSKLKMPVERCASLICSDMLRTRSTECWIAEQPVLTALYLHQYFPDWMQRLFQRIGTKRVAMFKAGLDLYDPESWKKQLPAATTTKTAAGATRESE